MTQNLPTAQKIPLKYLFIFRKAMKGIWIRPLQSSTTASPLICLIIFPCIPRRFGLEASQFLRHWFGGSTLICLYPTPPPAQGQLSFQPTWETTAKRIKLEHFKIIFYFTYSNKWEFPPPPFFCSNCIETASVQQFPPLTNDKVPTSIYFYVCVKPWQVSILASQLLMGRGAAMHYG